MSVIFIKTRLCQQNDHKTINAFATEKKHIVQYIETKRIDKIAGIE